MRFGFGMQPAGSQDYPILSCAHFHFLLDYVMTIHQRYRRTDRR